MRRGSVLNGLDADDAVGAVPGSALCQCQLVFADFRRDRVNRVVDLALIGDPEQLGRLRGAYAVTLAQVGVDTDACSRVDRIALTWRIAKALPMHLWRPPPKGISANWWLGVGRLGLNRSGSGKYSGSL